MKKVLLLMLTLLTLGFFAAPLSAQSALTVAEGTTTNSYVPIYGYWADADQHNQVIYPESLLGDMLTGSISSMTFYLNGNPAWNNSYVASLGITQNIQFSSSTHDASTLTQVCSGTISVSNNQLTFTFDAPYNYTGGNLLFDLVLTGSGYIDGSFYGISSTGASIYQYSYGTNTQNFLPKTTFTYTGGALCKTPSNLVVSNITTTSADLAWHGDLNASSYNIQYMLSSETDWTNAQTATVTGDTTTTLSNLQPSSSYKVRVQVECSDNTQTVWSSVKTFMTACDALTITATSSWTEGFEGYSGSGEQPFQCWATPVTTPGGGPFVYCGYSASCHNSQNSAELKGANNMLVLPEFTNDIHDLRLSFWATAVTPSNGTLEIGVLPDMDDLTSFEVLGTAGTPSSRDGVGNYMGPFDFNGIQASSGRIALRYTSSGTGNSWNLDDFTVELSPMCTSPVKTSVTSTGIDGHNATISWVDNDATHNSWTLYYKMSTETDNDWQAVTASDTFYTLTGLTPETTYNVYVVTNCNGVPSDDATLTHNFTTLVACPAPTAVTASPVYINDATITWNSTSTVFNIEYGETGFTQGTGTTQTVYDNTVTLDNLNAATSYTVYVQADCSGDNDGLSQWTSVQFTTLPSCPTPTQIHASNLTTTSADLEWTPGYQESEWEVKFGPQGFDPDTVVGDIVTGSPIYQLQNLNPNTRYDVYVRAVCSSSDSSAWSAVYYFLTPCAPASLPYTENFDGYPSWYSPDCWRKFENGNSGGYVSFGAYIYNEQAYSGDKALKFVAGSSSTGYALLRLPDFDTQDITELQVKIMAKKSSGSRPLIVGVAPDFNSVDSIYVLGTFSDLGSNYEEKIVSLESYPGTTGYIVIGLPKGYSSSATIYVDDVTVEVRPNCMYPTDFATTSVGETSVSLAWTELGTAQSWNIEYGPMGYTQGTGTTEIITDSTHYTVENLSASTAYDFYVQSDCGGFGSQWVGPLTVVTSQYLMGITGSDTITTCGMAIYDNGGPNGDYSISCNYTLVVNPANAGSGISITGTVSTYNGSSYYAGVLTIYAGVGTSGEVLGTFSGNATVNVAYAGPVTLNFTSGSYYSGAGFALIAQCTDCFPPTNVSISSITMTGATVTWSGAASEYSLLATSATDTAYATASDTTYTFTTLMPSSHYTVRVRSLCGGDSSLASAPVTFNTACDEITITETTPWVENFEGYSNHNFVCWETPVAYNASNGTFPMVYCGHAQSCYSGENSAEFKGDVNMLVLPAFTNNLSELRLSFWATAVPHPGSGVVEVGYVTDILDASTFVFVSDAGTPGPRGDQEHVAGNGNYMGPFDFNGVTAPAGSRIALRYTNASDATASWNLDDFTVSLAPNCLSPVKNSVTATNIGTQSATISFTDNDPNHNSWTVYYRPTTDSVWNQIVTGTTTVDLTNLDPHTSYYVYVVTNCATPDIVEDATLTIQFSTAVCELSDQCQYTFNLTDSYGDGWNGATITVQQNGITVATVAMTSGDFATEVVNLCDNQPTTLIWNTGNWDAEASFEVLTPSENVVYTSSTLSAGTLITFTSDCTLPSCPRPASISVTNIGATTVDVSWVPTGSESNWNLEYKTANDATWTVVPVTTTTYTLPNLTAGTNYSVRVQADCGAGDVSDYRETTFATANCEIANQCTYTFTLSDSYGDGWNGGSSLEVQQNGITVATLTLSNGSSSTEIISLCDNVSTSLVWNSNSVYFDYECGFSLAGPDGAVIYSATGMDNYTTYTFTTNCSGSSVTAPTVVTDAATNVTQTSATMNGTVTNPDNLSVTPMGFEWKEASAISATVVTVSGSALTYALDNLTPGTQYTYKAFITYNGTTIYGDEVPFTTQSQGQITNPTVATDAASTITQTSAMLNATITNPDNVTITAKGFEWKTTTGGTFTQIAGVGTGNTFTANLSGLTANTGYTYKAFITYNGNTVYGGEQTFTTSPADVEPCETPTNLHATEFDTHSITIGWNANGNATSWNIHYRVENGGWNNANTTTNTYVISGLVAETTYEIEVQADCGGGNLSDWSAPIHISTAIDGIESWLKNSVSLYPNPAKEYIDIRVDGDVNVTLMEVYDVYGKLINTMNVVENPTRINVSGLANGMYFVRVTTEKGAVTKTFVKK